MAGTIIADRLEAAATSQLVIENGVASTPPTIVDVNGTQVGTFCRAWVNFDGTGTFTPNPSTTKIRDEFNVSSITDNGVGDYTVTFTNPMPDANYVVCGMCGGVTSSGYVRIPDSFTPSANSIRVNGVNASGTTLADMLYMNVSVFR